MGAPPTAPAPRRKRGSYRRLMLELLIVTAGVLIALLIQSLVDWNHYRLLVRDAHSTITHEITTNRDEMKNYLAGKAERSRQVSDALTFADQMLATKTSDVQSLSLGFSFPDLGSSAWKTADQTGALSHMAYDDVQKYSHVYGLQDFVEEQERRTTEIVVSAAILVGAHKDPSKVPLEDIRVFRGRLLDLAGQLLLTNQLAEQLVARYDQALKR